MRRWDRVKLNFSAGKARVHHNNLLSVVYWYYGKFMVGALLLQHMFASKPRARSCAEKYISGRDRSVQ
jgi:hypothetical protein